MKWSLRRNCVIFATADSSVWFVSCLSPRCSFTDSLGVSCVTADAAEAHWSGWMCCRLWQEEQTGCLLMWLGGTKSSICHRFVFVNSGQQTNKCFPFQDHLLTVYLPTLNFLLLLPDLCSSVWATGSFNVETYLAYDCDFNSSTNRWSVFVSVQQWYKVRPPWKRYSN